MMSGFERYRLRQMAWHLADTGQRENLHRLLTENPDWMRDTFAYSRSDALYVEQVRLAISLYQPPTTSEECIQLVELWTTLIIVHQRVSHYTDTDLETLAWLGSAEEALNQARLRPSPNEAFQSLWKIYKVLEQKQQHNSRLFDELVVVAQQIDSLEQQAEVISDLANYLIEHGDLSTAAEISAAIESPLWRILLQGVFALALIKEKQVDEAKKLAQPIPSFIAQIQPPLMRITAQLGYAMTLTKLEMHDQAEQIFLDCEETVRELPAEDDQIQGFIALANSFKEIDNTRKAHFFFKQARKTAQEIIADPYRSMLLLILIGQLSKAQEYELAEAVIKDIPYEWMQAVPLGVLANVYKKAGNAEAAQRLFERMLALSSAQEDAGFRDAVLSAVVPAAAIFGSREQTETLMAQIQGANKRLDALRELANQLAVSGHIGWANEAFRQAQEAARGIEDKREQVEMLCAVTKVFLQSGDDIRAQYLLEKAENLLDLMSDIRLRREAAICFIDTLTQLELFNTLDSAIGRWVESNNKDEINLAIRALTAVGDLERANTHLALLHCCGSSEAMTFSQLSVAFSQRGDRQKALELAKQVVDHADFLAFSTGIAKRNPEIKVNTSKFEGELAFAQMEAFSAIAVSFAHDHDPTEANTYFERAYQISVEIADANIHSKALCTLWRAYRSIGESGTAFYDEARRFAESRVDVHEHDNALLSIIETLLEFGEIKRAAEICEQIREGDTRSQGLKRLVEKHLSEGRWQAALEITKRLEDAEVSLEVEHLLSRDYVRRGQFAEAIALLNSQQISQLIIELASWQNDFNEYFGYAGQSSEFQRLIMKVLAIAAWENPFWRDYVS